MKPNELGAEYSTRKSFYGKAVTEGNELLSYGKVVAFISDNDKQPKLIDGLWDYSNTTLRHLREWLSQNGFKVVPKKDLPKLYEIVNP
jgi:hypothetical protein